MPNLENFFQESSLFLETFLNSDNYGKSKYQLAFKKAPIGIIFSNDQGVVLDCNKFLADIFEATQEKYIGLNLLNAIPEGPVRQNLADAIADGTRHVYEGPYVSIFSGKKLELHISTEKVDDNLYLTLITDLTARKQAEKQLEAINEDLERRIELRTRELQEKQQQCLHSEKLAAIGKLSASIAHEFNNPLQSILAILKGLKYSDKLDKTDSEMLDLAIAENLRLKNLIRNLQDFNRPSPGTKHLIDLPAVIDSIFLLCKSDFKRRKIVAEVNFENKVPKVLAVPDQIKQVILNLINNAVDACPKDGGLIKICTRLEGQKVTVSVKDNGKGIKPDDIDRIFQPFYTTKATRRGTGLGLSICHGIIEGHRGKITVESKLGKGATFTFSLPLVLPET